MFNVPKQVAARKFVPAAAAICILIVYATVMLHIYSHTRRRSAPLGLNQFAYATAMMRHRSSLLPPLTGPQILAKSDPVFRLLVPEKEPFSLSLQLTPHGANDKHWWVFCNAPAGQQIACLAWDIHTGQLREVRNCLLKPRTANALRLPRLQAAQQAYHWLKLLGIASQEPRWQVTALHKRPDAAASSSWDFAMHGQRGHVYIKLDAYTGDLRWLTFDM